MRAKAAIAKADLGVAEANSALAANQSTSPPRP